MQSWSDINWSLGDIVANAENENTPNTNFASAYSIDDTGVNITPNDTAYTHPFADSSKRISFDVDAFETFRLPRFWRHLPQHWFRHAEALFHNQRVRSDLSRVNHVLASLDDDGVRIVSDLLGSNVQYSAVKSRLITAYAILQATSFSSTEQHGGTDDRLPSLLLSDLLKALPDGIGEPTLNELWLKKLSPTILAIISGLEGLLESLAELANRVAAASAGHDIAAVATSHSLDRQQTMENAISALTEQIAALITSQSTQNRPSRSRCSSRSKCRNRSKSRHRSESRNRSGSLTHSDAWCYYHNSFGNEARKCRDPCFYSSEN